MAVINTVAYDFQDIEIGITLGQFQGGKLVTLAELPILDGSEEINFSTKIEDEDMYGALRLPQGETDGTAKFDGSLGMLFYQWDWLHRTIAEAGIGWATARLTTSILFTKPGLDVSEVLLYAARIMGDEGNFKRGNENIRVTMPIKPRCIYKNGLDPFGNPLT